MRIVGLRYGLGIISVAATAVLLAAHAPVNAEQAGRGRGAGGFTSPPAEPATRLFREVWNREMAQPMVQGNLSNQSLILHIYRHADEIRKTTHPTEDYTYTGGTTSNWTITVSDPKRSWDLTRDGRVRRLRTRNSGFRTTHVVIKTADGRYFAREEGSPESSAWIERDYIFRDLTWRALLMTDTPTNASNRRQPDPGRVPIIPTARATPDLTRVDEVGHLARAVVGGLGEGRPPTVMSRVHW